MLKGKSFFVSGGTGSFGNTLVKFLLKTDIARILCFSRDESKQSQMRIDFPDERIEFVLGDIRNLETVKRNLENIDYVFHAAALKHVPVSEKTPWEFIQTNIQGSHNLLQSLIHSSVQKAIFLSTDKAVYPINAMGMTKALMEKLVRSNDYRSNTSCSITRYGNVIGSRGSVIPYFIKALKSGKDVSITNPDMTRFIMSLSESVELVMFALEKGNRGDLFIQKSPAATVETILYGVADLLKIKNPQIKIVGIRPGEKIHETLLNSEEKSLAEDFGKYFRVPSIGSDASILNGSLKDFDEYSSNNTKLLSRSELKDLLSSNSEIIELIKN